MNENDARACKSEDTERSIGGICIEDNKRMEEPKQEILRRHEINIRFLSRGCVIRVGCKEIPFENNEVALLAIRDFLNDPQGAINAWSKEFNKVSN